jgi:hypothetical protein
VALFRQFLLYKSDKYCRVATAESEIRAGVKLFKKQAEVIFVEQVADGDLYIIYSRVLSDFQR